MIRLVSYIAQQKERRLVPSSPLAVADACVLVPAALSDFLLRSAAAGLYQIRWSDDILDEVLRTLVGDLGRSAAQAQRRVAAMKTAFPDALVSGYHSLIATAPEAVDPKDRHVVAAALASGAPTIITSNLRDFPVSALSPLAIRPRSPDDFLTDLYAEDLDLAVTVIMEQAAILQSPPYTSAQVLDFIGRQAPAFAAHLRPMLNP